MLTITIPETELFDEENSSIEIVKERELQLEHSLLSISKWESIWKKPFLSNTQKTRAEILSYVKCMTVGQPAPDIVYSKCISNRNLHLIEEYIDDKMTATTISNRNRRRSSKIITSEVIYCWMIQNSIPFECQKWHLNRLLMLIEVCSIENGPKKKMSQKDVLSRNDALNEMRKAKYKTSG